MNELNPYAPPAADVDSVRSQTVHGFWREGDVLVTPSGQSIVLPDRCVHCNEPAGGFKLKRTVYWHNPALYLLIVVSVLIYVIVALIVRKSIKLEVGLCERHRKRRQLGLALVFTGLLSPFVLLALHESLGDALVLLIPLTSLASLIAGAVLSRVLHAKRIDGNYARLKVGAPFLASIDTERS